MEGDYKIRTHKDLLVWQKAVDFVIEIYNLTKSFPRDELYTLVSQIRRAAVSIPSNIAEGAARQSRKEFQHFLYIALGSVSELETQLIICRRLGYLDCHEETIFLKLEEIRRMLLGLLHQLKKSS